VETETNTHCFEIMRDIRNHVSHFSCALLAHLLILSEQLSLRFDHKEQNQILSVVKNVIIWRQKQHEMTTHL
jgi:hypothetical protein